MKVAASPRILYMGRCPKVVFKSLIPSHSFPFVRSEKRRRILIALRAVVISSEVEKSFSFAVKHFM